MHCRVFSNLDSWGSTNKRPAGNHWKGSQIRWKAWSIVVERSALMLPFYTSFLWPSIVFNDIFLLGFLLTNPHFQPTWSPQMQINEVYNETVIFSSKCWGMTWYACAQSEPCFSHFFANSSFQKRRGLVLTVPAWFSCLPKKQILLIVFWKVYRHISIKFKER